MKPSMKGERGGTMGLSAFKIKKPKNLPEEAEAADSPFFFFFYHNNKVSEIAPRIQHLFIFGTLSQHEE